MVDYYSFITNSLRSSQRVKSRSALAQYSLLLLLFHYFLLILVALLFSSYSGSPSIKDPMIPLLSMHSSSSTAGLEHGF